MIEWEFLLDDLQIEEPDNFSDLFLGLKRDPDYHGIMFEASLGGLEFGGAGARYILAKEKQHGLKAVITFIARSRCDEYGEFTEEVRGKLNMGDLEESCGDECSVKVPIEQENCTMLVRNRFDQKVDMDSLTAFDKITSLQAYPRAGFNISIPGKELLVGAEGFVDTAGDTIDYNNLISGAGARSYVRPTYLNKRNESINLSELEPSAYVAGNGGPGDFVISPVVLIDEVPSCFDGHYEYAFRFKGHAFLTGRVTYMRIRIVKGLLPDEENPLLNLTGMTVLKEHIFILNSEQGVDVFDQNFDQSFDGTTTLQNGEGLWGYFHIFQLNRGSDGGGSDGSFVRFDKETYVKVQAHKLCPPTDVKVYAVNETLSRVTEAITNGCLKVKSDYYGRTDSLPYNSKRDGCGSLRVLNSGLQLRKSEDAKFFLSLKDGMEGLRGIDNIGYGIEPDEARPGFDVLRIEPAENFYRDEEIIALPAAPGVKIKTDEGDFYSIIKTGYAKWEVEDLQGLDEVNANREFRTSLNSISNPLDITSKLIAGSYAIERTRQQSFATTGGADTKYDNETFIYCMKRAGGGFDIEQGGITGPTNIFSPATLFNWRIRPMYNLMRWFKTIAASYANLDDTDNKIFFTSGSANYLASGEQTGLTCKLENGQIAENTDLSKNNFKQNKDYLPIWKPKNATFTYPLSMGDYKKIKASPYGYISVQCGNGDWIKGFINTLKFSPTQGEGQFNLKLKWE